MRSACRTGPSEYVVNNAPWPDHQLANELKVISRILDDNPQTLELIVQDLSDRVDSSVGAPGLTAEQVLRCAVIKQLHQFSYRKLEFHLVDSQSCQRFCRLPYGASISKATLAENLGKIEPGTWKAINDHLVRWAQARGLEKGQRIRVDATAVQTNVHIRSTVRPAFESSPGPAAGLGRDRLRRSHATGQAARPEHPQPPRQEAPGETI